PANKGKATSVGAGESAPSSARNVEPSAPVRVDIAAPQPMVATQSSPVSMQPSGPVPKVESVASGSGPTKPTIALPTSLYEALVAWSKVIEYLAQQRKISLRGYYEFARVLSWTASDLELGFAPDDDSKWAGENAAEAANIAELRTLLADLGHKVKVTVRMLDQAESAGTTVR